MNFRSASLAELRKFVKLNGIKGVSAMKKGELAEYLENLVHSEPDRVFTETESEEKTTETKSTEAKTVKADKKKPEKEAAEDVNSSAKNNQYGQNRGRQSYQASQANPRVDYVSDTNKDRVIERQNNYGDRRSDRRFDRRNSNSNNQNNGKQERYEQRTEYTHRNERNQNQTTDEPSQMSEYDSGKVANGILEVMSEGYGFIRSANYMPGDQDIYLSPQMIRRFGLKTGDIIAGNIKIKTQSEKFSALLYIQTINGEDPNTISKRKPFEELTPIFPNERIVLDGNNSPVPIRMMDLLSPIGKGQRGMIVSPPKTGKTTLLKQIAKKISNTYDDIHLLVLLIDERPEEVTDIRESIEGPNVEVIYSTFDELPEHHKRVSEMVIERGKRLVEQKKDVVILLDSITRLARAYNLTVQPSGRTLSGGLDPAALHMPKKFFGAARNMREGGSLTILATALVDTGSKLDDVVFEEFKGTGNMELVLDRKLSEKRIFPAIDIAKSGTRRDDLLLNKEEQEVVYALHKALLGNKAEDVLEDVLKLFVRTKNNEEFMYYVKKSLLRK